MDTLLYKNQFDLTTLKNITSFSDQGAIYAHYNAIRALETYLSRTKCKVISDCELPNWVNVQIYCSDEEALSIAFNKPRYSDELTDFIIQSLKNYLEDHSETETSGRSAEDILDMIIFHRRNKKAPIAGA